MTRPKLSIGMPVHNGERYMRRAIESVLAQSFADWELIISDNASTDGTARICAEFERFDPRIRVIRQDPLIDAAANFRGVYDESRGQYFMWLACDDWWRPGFFERAVAVLDADPRVSLVFSHFEIYNWATDSFEARHYVVGAHGTFRTRFTTRVLNPCPHAFYGMFRRTSTNPFDEIPPVDFSDILFTEYMAAFGDTVIIDGYLFVAGLKDGSGQIHPLSGKRFRYAPYWRAAVRLVGRRCRGITRIVLLLLITRQTLQWLRTYR